MKSLFVFFILFSTSTQGYKIKRVEEVGIADNIEFDSYGNTYINDWDGGGQWGNWQYCELVKLNDRNEVTLQQDFFNSYNILVNKKNDVYIFGYKNHTQMDSVASVWRLRSNSTDLEIITAYESGFWFENYLIDKDDNIFFNTKSGAVILKPEQNIPSAIAGLEGKVFDDQTETDDGNVYLKYGSTLYVVTKEAKAEPVPHAEMVSTKVKYFIGWRNITFVIEEFNGRSSTLKKVENGQTDVMLQQYYADFYFFGSTNERLFVVENSTIYNLSHIYIINERSEVISIDESLDSTILNNAIIDDYSITQLYKKYAFDSEGTAYFAYVNAEKLYVLILRYDEVTLRKVYVPAKGEIWDLKTDKEDNLWILADELYVLPKGSDAPVQVSSSEFAFPTEWRSSLKAKRQTNEIFVDNTFNLYLVTEN